MKKLMQIVEEIERILRERKIASHDITGFDEAEQRDWYFIDLSHSGINLGIDVCRECTIYFGDWHGHYHPETEWDEFIQTLNKIFDNELCSLGAYVGSIEPQNAVTAVLARSEDINEEYITNEFGTEKLVKSCFFNPSLDREYRV